MLSASITTTGFRLLLYLQWGVGIGGRTVETKKVRFSTFWPLPSFPVFVFQVFPTWTLHFGYTDLLTPKYSFAYFCSFIPEPPCGMPCRLFIFITKLLTHLIRPNWVPTYTILNHSNPVNCLLSGSYLYTCLYLLYHQFDYKWSVPS